MKEFFLMVIGGIALLVTSFIVNVFLQAPPSRAEFDELRAKSVEINRSVERRLESLENGQKDIIEILLK